MAVEGGGMRGVVSGAMVLALDRLGLGQAFDAVYGSSAGAFNASYFLAGQADRSLLLYQEAMPAAECFDLRRILRWRPPLSLDWLLDVGMERISPLDWSAVLSNPTRLFVIASAIDDLRTVTLTDLTSKADLRTALMASARIPFLAGPPVEFRGLRLLDAAVLQAHPYESAVADGCTHVLSLSTRPAGELRRPPTWTERLMAVRLQRLRPGLGARSLDRIRNYRIAQERLIDLTSNPGACPHVLDVAPEPRADEVRQLDRDLRRVLAGARAGYEATVLALEKISVRAFVQFDHARGA